MSDLIMQVLITIFGMVMLAVLVVSLVFFGSETVREQLPTVCFIFGLYLGVRVYLTFKK